MIQNAKRNTHNPMPFHPKQGKARLNGIDSFEATNQIVLSKDQDNAACELIWTSYKNLLSGDIYNEIDNADDLVNWLTVLLSDENGKQTKAYKVLPANSNSINGWSTIDSDAEEGINNNVRNNMKKMTKGISKSIGKRDAEDTALMREKRGKNSNNGPYDIGDILSWISSTSLIGTPISKGFIDLGPDRKKRFINDLVGPHDYSVRVDRTGKSGEYPSGGSGKGKNLSIGEALQWMQSLVAMGNTDASSGVNIGKRSAPEMVRDLLW